MPPCFSAAASVDKTQQVQLGSVLGQTIFRDHPYIMKYAKNSAATMRLLRVVHGLTQTDLGRAAGVSQAHISKVENGRCRPGVRVGERIAKRLGTPAHQLFPHLVPQVGRPAGDGKST